MFIVGLPFAVKGIRNFCFSKIIFY